MWQSTIHPVLYHDTLWTVVTVSNGLRGISRFDDAESAKVYADKTNGYILAPSGI
jgi:hypothetical protein